MQGLISDFHDLPRRERLLEQSVPHLDLEWGLPSPLFSCCFATVVVDAVDVELIYANLISWYH